MSTPTGFKKQYKNITWTNEEEKRAFFNKYFKGGPLVREEINNKLRDFKGDIKSFIERGEITVGKTTRKITNQDIIGEIG